MVDQTQTAKSRTFFTENCQITLSSPVFYFSANRELFCFLQLPVCSKYPACNSYVRVHPGTKIPMGTMANRQLRALRNEAHRNFDQLHKKGLMSKEDAYHWLASILAAPLGQAHIGYLGEYYCKQVIEESKKVLDLQKNKRQGMTA